MSKIRLFIIVVCLLNVALFAQTNDTFERYLSKFKCTDSKILNNQDFQIGLSNGFQLASLEEAIEYIQLDKEVSPDTYFSCLYKVEFDQYVVTIVATSLDALYSEEFYSIIVYAKKDGTIHDRLDLPKRRYGLFITTRAALILLS